MRTVYRVLAYLLALSVAVQASLIAFGAFALENNIDNGPVSDGDTTGVTLHHSFAYVVLLCAVALLAVSFGAKVPHGVRWAAIPLGLVVVQFFLAYAAWPDDLTSPYCRECPSGRQFRLRSPGHPRRASPGCPLSSCGTASTIALHQNHGQGVACVRDLPQE